MDCFVCSPIPTWVNSGAVVSTASLLFSCPLCSWQHGWNLEELRALTRKLNRHRGCRTDLWDKTAWGHSQKWDGWSKPGSVMETEMEKEGRNGTVRGERERWAYRSLQLLPGRRDTNDPEGARGHHTWRLPLFRCHLRPHMLHTPPTILTNHEEGSTGSSHLRDWMFLFKDTEPNHTRLFK